VRYNFQDLGQRVRGTIVEVRLSGTAANVQLLDSSNYAAFKAGRRYQGIGRHVKTTAPLRLAVPHSGHWFVTIDYGGGSGRGRASVRVGG
jgi:hypothetical protein